MRVAFSLVIRARIPQRLIRRLTSSAGHGARQIIFFKRFPLLFSFFASPPPGRLDARGPSGDVTTNHPAQAGESPELASE
jgi:hypothetical protein